MRRSPGSPAAVPRHSRHGGRPHLLRAVGIITFTVVVAAASFAAAAAHRLDRNVTHVDIAGLVDEPASRTTTGTQPDDPRAGRAVTILLLGSDDRSGQNAAIGGQNAGMRSDTAIVMHVSADRRRLELVSIPRDSLVDIPACRLTNGTTTQPHRGAMVNEAFAIGWDQGGDLASAAACSISTVQAATGVHVDHVAVVDFAGFQRMVDAVGGVDVCVPRAMTDEKTGLNLRAGRNELDGAGALQFARARYETGSDGSDLARIGHQQQLLAALAHKALSRSVLTDPVRLLTFADSATAALTTDSGLTSTTVTGLAYSLRGIAAADIVFTTVPNGPAPQDRYRVIWTPPADRLWRAMAADTPITAALAPAPSARPTGSTPTTPGATPTGPPAAGDTPLPKDVTTVDTVQLQAVAACGA